MRFYLGTHKPGWLAHAGIPLFISRNALVDMKTLPRAISPWALDSGGFTEITGHGHWRVNAKEFVSQVRRIRDEIGMMEWTAPMDWMTELCALVGSGEKLKRVHIQRSVDSWFEIKNLAPELPLVPVLQGGDLGSYIESMVLFEKRGVDLSKQPLVGLGSVCRQQGELEVSRLIYFLVAHYKLTVHAFGFKVDGLALAASLLHSADSLAWSKGALREPPLPGHDKPGPGRRFGHVHCNNCMEYAMRWYRRLTSDPVIGELHYPWNTKSKDETRFRAWLFAYENARHLTEKRKLVAKAERDFPLWLKHSMVMDNLRDVEKVASGWQDPMEILHEREALLTAGKIDENDRQLAQARADLDRERADAEKLMDKDAATRKADLADIVQRWGKKHVKEHGVDPGMTEKEAILYWGQMKIRQLYAHDAPPRTPEERAAFDSAVQRWGRKLVDELIKKRGYHMPPEGTPARVEYDQAVLRLGTEHVLKWGAGEKSAKTPTAVPGRPPPKPRPAPAAKPGKPAKAPPSPPAGRPVCKGLGRLVYPPGAKP